MTDWYMSGELDEDRIDPVQRFSSRSKHQQRDKTLRTPLKRDEEQAHPTDIQSLPIWCDIQVYSLYCNVEHEGKIWLCVIRKTLAKVSGHDIIAGDLVRFRDLGATDESGQPEAIVEQVFPRQTVLTRTDSFKETEAHPIVANAEQMLIVASVHEPNVKWGLIDRMIVAARSGRLVPILCLNKTDLSVERTTDKHWTFAQEALRHYESLEIRTLQASVTQNEGLEELRDLLRGRTTVLAGHSGVGKSSLIRAIQANLEIRIGAISGYTGKGRHTTTSARRYPLEMGGYVIDTPGVKLFGLWGVTRENLSDFFPDIAAGTAPQWRQESYQRIAASLAG